MLVCNVSQRARRAAIAADIAEAALALDSATLGHVVFAALVDDPANVQDRVDAFLGQIMVEAAAAASIVNAGLTYAAAVAEAATATDVTAGSVPLVVIEAATASTAQDASIVAAPSTTWNPSDKSANVALSGGNLAATTTSASASGVRATASKTTGKFYFEITCTGTIANSGVGVATATAPLTGTASMVIINVATGGTFVNNSFYLTASSAFVSGDVCCVAVDLANRTCWFRKNGGQWNGSGTANPSTNTGGIDMSPLFSAGAAEYPVVTFPGTGLTHTANFGATSFSQSMPSGFASWQ